MLDFEKELDKFKPILNINHIEEHIKQGTIGDLSDLLSRFNKETYGHPGLTQEINDKE